MESLRLALFCACAIVSVMGLIVILEYISGGS